MNKESQPDLYERLESSIKNGVQKIFVPEYVRESIMHRIEETAKANLLTIKSCEFSGDWCTIEFVEQK